MATDADTGSQINAAEVWQTIGRLEGDVAAFLEGQREIKTDLKAGLDETNRRLDEGLREVNRRVDRLFYAMLAVGGGLLVAVLVSRIIDG